MAAEEPDETEKESARSKMMSAAILNRPALVVWADAEPLDVLASLGEFLYENTSSLDSGWTSRVSAFVHQRFPRKVLKFA